MRYLRKSRSAREVEEEEEEQEEQEEEESGWIKDVGGGNKDFKGRTRSAQAPTGVAGATGRPEATIKVLKARAI